MENPSKIDINADKRDKIIANLPKYSEKEELINVITHLSGAIIGLIAAIAMLIISIKSFTWQRLTGSFLFGLSLIYLYGNSALYHNARVPEKRIVRQKLDHSSINVLISGSNTFFLLAGMNDDLGYILCGINWALSLVSIALNAVNVKKFRAISMVIYILTGWMSIFIAPWLLEAIGTAFWIVLSGGLFYTFGLIFYAIKKPFMHSIWHVFVLLGSIMHIIAAFMILIK